MKVSLSQNKGFTLIELLVVISIISLLASIILASLNNARVRAKETSRVASLREMQNALALYYSDNAVYPGVVNQWYLLNTDCSSFSGYTFFSAIMPTTYISSIAKDLGVSCGWYKNFNNGQGYWLLFDPDDNSWLAKDDPNCNPAEQSTYYCVGVGY